MANYIEISIERCGCSAGKKTTTSQYVCAAVSPYIIMLLEATYKLVPTTATATYHGKLLGAWCFGGKRRQGGQLETLRISYLDLLRKLQFDTNDSALICGSNGTLRIILELICNEPVEFN